MGVDVADRVGVELAVAQGQVHRPGRAGAGLVGLRDVAAVGAGAVAQHLGVDAGAASLGVFQLLEHQHAGPFAEHEAVAIAVERAAGLWRIVVAFGQRPHVGKAADAHRRDAPPRCRR